MASSHPRDWLSKHGFNPDGDLRQTTFSRREGFSYTLNTAMYEASACGELDVCHFLFERGAAADIKTRNNRGNVPMHVACDNGYLKVAQWLFGTGVSTNVRIVNNFGNAPMHMTCFKGHLDVAKWLFEVGAAPDIHTKSISGNTAMKDACLGGHLHVAKWLYEVGAAKDIMTRDNSGQTPMHEACAAGHLDVAKWLFKVGAADDVRAKNMNGRSPIFRACHGGHVEVARWLLMQGAANDESGHVSPEILRGEVLERFLQQGKMSTLVSSLQCLKMEHNVFLQILATASRGAAASSEGGSVSPRKQTRLDEHRISPLAKLCGHESTLLMLIADFLDVARGRQLRNLREANWVLTEPRKT